MGLKDKEPQTVEIKGNVLKCHVCGNGYFWNRKAQLNTAAMSFLNLDWANKSAICFICSECTYIHWFLG